MDLSYIPVKRDVRLERLQQLHMSSGQHRANTQFGTLLNHHILNKVKDINSYSLSGPCIYNVEEDNNPENQSCGMRKDFTVGSIPTDRPMW